MYVSTLMQKERSAEHLTCWNVSLNRLRSAEFCSTQPMAQHANINAAQTVRLFLFWKDNPTLWFA